jgi:hypothetical protein
MVKAIEPLGKHDRATFSCGVTALDDWFRLRAGQDEKRNVARVFVAIDDQLGIVGFYSLSSFTLAVADLPPEQAKRKQDNSICRRSFIAAAITFSAASLCGSRRRTPGPPPFASMNSMPAVSKAPDGQMVGRGHLCLARQAIAA